MKNDNTNKIIEVEQHIKEALKILGADEKLLRDKETPYRIAKMWTNEFFKNDINKTLELDNQMKSFLYKNTFENFDRMIIIKGIDFSSICEHHLLPFSGKVNIAYIPRDSVLGLSKFPRIVEYFSKYPTLQEKLTDYIGNYIYSLLKYPRFVMVHMKASHTCVMCRGAESINSSTDTMYINGHETNPDKVELFKQEYFYRVKE